MTGGLLTLLIAIAFLGCSRKPSNAPLDQSSAAKGFVAHYPKDFAVSYTDVGIVILKRTVSGGAEEKIFLDAYRASDADTNDLQRAAKNSFAIFAGSDEKEGASYTHVDRLPTKCVGQPAIETTASVERPSGESQRFRACTVVRDRVKYNFSYWVPASLVGTDEAELRRIVDATELVAIPIEDAGAATDSPNSGLAPSTAPIGPESIVTRMRPAFRACYDKGLARDPSMTGLTRIVTTVDPYGGVLEAFARGTTGLSEDVTKCLVGVVKGAHFDASPAGTTLEIPARFEQPRPQH